MSTIAIATTTGGSAGVNVASGGSAHTKASTWTQLTSSCPADVDMLHVVFHHSTAEGRWYLVDIGTGGSGSEVAIVSNIWVYMPSPSRSAIVNLPVHIASGTRVAARCQDSTGGGSIDLQVTGRPASAYLPVGISAAASWSAPCANTATSQGFADVDAGGTANTFAGTANNITASAAIAATQMIISTTDANNGANECLVRIKVNGTVVVQPIYHPMTNGDGNTFFHGPFEVTVAATDTITAEVSCSGNTAGAREIRVGVYLMNVAAPSAGGSTVIDGEPMSRALKDGETTAAKKRAFFRIRDSAGAPWAGSVTGVKAQLSISGATEAASTNDIVRVGGVWHYVELDNTEAAAAAAGDVILARVAAATGRLEAEGMFEVFPDDPFAAVLTPAETLYAQFQALADGLFEQDSTTITLNGVTLTVSRPTALNAPGAIT